MLKNLDLGVKIEEYLNDRARRDLFSPRTDRVVRSVLRTLAPTFSSPYHSYQRLKKSGHSLYTIKTYFNYASTFEQDALGSRKYAEYLKENRSAFKNCYKDKTRIISREEFDRLMVQADPAIKNLFVLMGEAGLRLSEALNAKWKDLNNGLLKVVGKGNKQRLIPFDQKKLIRNGYANIVSELSLKKVRALMKPFTPHDLRAYYATFIANHPELNIKDAAMLLGHSSITTTSRYVRSDLNRIAKVLDASSNSR